MAVIYIKDLIVTGNHGWHDFEKTKPQRFKINVELSVDLSKAAQSDQVEDTVNWSPMRDKITDIVANNSFNLMERLAQEIADQLLDDKRIQKIVVAVDKIDAFKTGVPGVRLEAP